MFQALAHLQDERADPGLTEPEGGHGGAVAGADDDRGGGFDRVGLGRVGRVEADAGEAEGGRRLQGGHTKYVTSRQLTLHQFCCHVRSMCGFSGSG